jgi:hypothetical protein
MPEPELPDDRGPRPEAAGGNEAVERPPADRPGLVPAEGRDSFWSGSRRARLEAAGVRKVMRLPLPGLTLLILHVLHGHRFEFLAKITEAEWKSSPDPMSVVEEKLMLGIAQREAMGVGTLW